MAVAERKAKELVADAMTTDSWNANTQLLVAEQVGDAELAKEVDHETTADDSAAAAESAKTFAERSLVEGLAAEHRASEAKVEAARYIERADVEFSGDLVLVAIPADCICPITQELMQDPVVAADGNSYERVAIETWLARGSRTSPLTNELLPHTTLTPNLTLKKVICDLEARMPQIQRKQLTQGHSRRDVQKVIEDVAERHDSAKGKTVPVAFVAAPSDSVDWQPSAPTLVTDAREMPPSQDLDTPSMQALRAAREPPPPAASSSGYAAAVAQPEASHTHEVQRALDGAGLGTFAKTFVDNGWDEVALFSSISDEDLAELGVKSGFRAKFRRAFLDEGKGQEGDNKERGGREPEAKPVETLSKPLKPDAKPPEPSQNLHTQQQNQQRNKVVDMILDGRQSENGLRGWVNMILDGRLSVTATDSSGQTALHIAARKGDALSVKALVDARADATLSDNNGCQTALHAAFSRGTSITPSILKLLLDARAVIDAADHQGKTVLHLAAAAGDIQSLHFLLDARANIGILPTPALAIHSGWTALHYAASSGHVSACRALLNARSDLETKSGSNTALHLAVKSRNDSSLKFLMGARANTSAIGKEGKTALHIAALNGDISSIETLVDARADVAASDLFSERPIDMLPKGLRGNIFRDSAIQRLLR